MKCIMLIIYMFPVFVFCQTSEVYLSEIQNTYRTLDVYSDEVEFVVTRISERGEKIIRGSATTFFDRKSGKFVFKQKDYYQLGHIDVERDIQIIREAKDSFCLFSAQGNGRVIEDSRVASLARGIAKGTGITHKVAHIVPNLLIEEVGGAGFANMEEIEILEAKEISGIECVGIKGIKINERDTIPSLLRQNDVMGERKLSFRVETEIIYWYRKTDNLLVKVEEIANFESFQSFKTITIDPKIGKLD